MPCQHTSFEIRGAAIVCRTCGEDSTKVYYGGSAGNRTVSAGGGGGGSGGVNIVYRPALYRPENFVTVREGDPRAAVQQLRLENKLDALISTLSDYKGAFRQPLVSEPQTPRSWMTMGRTLTIIGTVAGTSLGSGLVFHQVSMIAAGVAGFGYLAATYGASAFGIADAMKREMSQYRKRAEVRTSVIPTYGFGGRDLPDGPMTEMIERVARLLCLGDPDMLVYVEDGLVVSWPGPASERVMLWTLQMPRARTVIEAMREPTEDMEAAGLAHREWPWPHMIDAALSK